ncbi:imidazole glycerol phosphate synthase subunit HisH [Plasticicumulans acidivorans]|uniref:Imidazole glycerol phosphate synthase subunit HisH n=1 Tax=Plasticicumulans acidivorans TaxID=886464 RepID=A0A317MZ28_9GAMM|nr:imidazole glycerol phosphate synthase subunit HisH [Plasticicumulans acidivorans]PWV64691.1 imidazole glycerol phosphate synthase subunit HisH [Plasticicumulans acidivorans]
MSVIAVVDYGMGNLHSVAKALERVAPSARIVLTQDAAVVRAADRVVFPGQGAIGHCMSELARLDLVEPLRQAAHDKPLLGMCLGPQALMTHSDENGGVAGLGVFAGDVRRFPDGLSNPANGERLKIPHMGWSRVQQTAPHPLWAGIEQGARFYFVHSYYLLPQDRGIVAGTTEYGFEFASALASGNVFAAQFHPEKSAAAGLRLLANFAAWDPSRDR